VVIKGGILLIGIGLFSLFGLIFWGLMTMIRRTDGGVLSNQLMRWRVFTQGAVLIIFTLLLLFKGK